VLARENSGIEELHGAGFLCKAGPKPFVETGRVGRLEGWQLAVVAASLFKKGRNLKL